MWKYFVLLILVPHAFSDSCVTYTFEEDYDVLFVNNLGNCDQRTIFWSLGNYENTTLTDHNEFSTKFIYPDLVTSCASSFMFPMRSGGTVEVNLFMESTSSIDLIDVWAFRRIDNVRVGYAYNSAFEKDTFVSGWHTLTMTINSGDTGDFIGYINMVGEAVSSSTVLIDSFRYIPPNMDESECQIYSPEPTEAPTVVTESTLESESTTDMADTTTTTQVKAEQTTTEAPTTDSDTEKPVFTIPLILLIVVVLCCIGYCGSKCDRNRFTVKVKHVNT